ncbi:MAG: hypothetical protein FXF47_09050 [Candidatus Mcinerneyibacterium aminivorans]|uniref:Uncharacterized protein n=1 Tax=Candidatus Mcinerneyibacterium aminivorans TaxID=2703815 RepID=A0A5D0MG82_9BACT|nr:MAG: hypothetical protein FXF47_09050 [Candidatus Mcinerneyibacterium aminivorans]
MITIKCAKCKNKIIKYHKVGRGKTIRVYYDRIHKDYSKSDKNKLICDYCGNIIGYKKEKYIKMRDIAFTYSGHKKKK